MWSIFIFHNFVGFGVWQGLHWLPQSCQIRFTKVQIKWVHCDVIYAQSYMRVCCFHSNHVLTFRVKLWMLDPCRLSVLLPVTLSKLSHDQEEDTSFSTLCYVSRLIHIWFGSQHAILLQECIIATECVCVCLDVYSFPPVYLSIGAQEGFHGLSQPAAIHLHRVSGFSPNQIMSAPSYATNILICSAAGVEIRCQTSYIVCRSV